ncbi:MAG: aspartyl/asparaginyl beta-hydroxylase domain-containing protein, partial [Fuerstiella sp.]|nr:aspartyl/asparaginyl beta-hydroxylase domain-containing protein [Fuerstiella sp.]
RTGSESAAHDHVSQMKLPVYYERSELPWADKVEQEFNEIRSEICMSTEQDSPSFNVAYDNAFMETGDFWTARNIIAWGLTSSEEYPKTLQLMREIGALNCFISRLAPGSDLKKHNGESDGYIRCHLPLVVPGGLPDVGLEVAEQKRPWVEGQIIAFNDLQYHGAFNFSEKERVVLIFDVMRPEAAGCREYVCCRWLCIYTFLAMIEMLQRVTGKTNRVSSNYGVGEAVFEWLTVLPRTLFWLLFRYVFRRPPFWFSFLRSTGTYF